MQLPSEDCNKSASESSNNLVPLTYAMFTLWIFTAVKEFTDLGKFLVNVNIN